MQVSPGGQEMRVGLPAASHASYTVLSAHPWVPGVHAPGDGGPPSFSPGTASQVAARLSPGPHGTLSTSQVETRVAVPSQGSAEASQEQTEAVPTVIMQQVAQPRRHREFVPFALAPQVHPFASSSQVQRRHEQDPGLGKPALAQHRPSIEAALHAATSSEGGKSDSMQMQRSSLD